MGDNSIFKDRITNVDNQIAIKTPGRKILLIMDNETGHIIPDTVFQSINILFLLPKSISESSNKLSLVNDSAQIQELINDFTVDSQLDADEYLNIENEVMNDDINSMPSSSSYETEVDTDISKPIYCSETLTSTEVLMLFFQQQPEDKSQSILDITRYQQEIERQQSKKFQ